MDKSVPAAQKKPTAATKPKVTKTPAAEQLKMALATKTTKTTKTATKKTPAKPSPKATKPLVKKK